MCIGQGWVREPKVRADQRTLSLLSYAQIFGYDGDKEPLKMLSIKWRAVVLGEITYATIENRLLSHMSTREVL